MLAQSPAPIPLSPVVVAPAVQLSAAMAALPQPAAAMPTFPDPFVGTVGGSAGDAIINGYNAIEPWVQYGVELSAWAVGWVPWPIGLAGPQATIVYSGIEPVTQAVVYSTAYLVDGMPELIPPTLANGVQTGITNFWQGEVSWIAGFLPPLPPISFPPLPGATTAKAGNPAAAVAEPAAAVSEVAAAPAIAESAVAEPAPEAIAPAPSRTAQPARRAAVPAVIAAPAAAAAEAPSVAESVAKSVSEVTPDPAPVTKAHKATRGGSDKAGTRGHGAR